MSVRQGPRIVAMCTGCAHHDSRSYRVQGDGGRDHFCRHPDAQTGEPGTDPPRTERFIADSDNTTPTWCPLLADALRAAAGGAT